MYITLKKIILAFIIYFNYRVFFRLAGLIFEPLFEKSNQDSKFQTGKGEGGHPANKAHTHCERIFLGIGV